MGEQVTGSVSVMKVTPQPKKKKKLVIKAIKGKVSIKGRTTAKGRAAFVAAVRKAAKRYIK